jgi:hypothetical protein
MMEPVMEILLDALKLALAEPGEQRLFRSGKLAGLFAGRTGVNAEAATREAALRRAEAAGAELANGVGADVPWAVDALAYLDHRRTGGASGDCPLPELFAALRDRHPGLSVNAFHDHLRRLQDRRALRLLAFTGAPSDIPEPEYALLDGANLLYYVSR